MREFYEAIDRYEGYRAEAFGFSGAALDRKIFRDKAFGSLAGTGLWIGPIDAAAIENWRENRLEPIFPWDTLYDDFRPYIDRFEVAIWANGRICGMAIGRPSKGPNNVTIHFGERWMSDNNPIGGLFTPIVTEVANAYALVLGKEWVKIKDPVPGAIPAYVREGFAEGAMIGRTRYLERRVII